MCSPSLSTRPRYYCYISMKFIFVFNPNMTYLLNGSVVTICLSGFIKMKKKNYEKTNK